MKKEIREKLAADLGLNANEIENFIDEFMVEFSDSASVLSAQFGTLDTMVIRQETHKIIGYAGNCGASDLFTAARDLNAAAKVPDEAAMQSGIERIIDLLSAYASEP